MRYADMNEQIDRKIKQLQARTSYDLNAQAQIDALQQQREANLQRMHQPMSAQEFAEYDDNGNYLGDKSQISQNTNQTPQNNFMQSTLDGVNHAAQGISLGWSDEIMGAIGGTGRVMGNGIARGLGYSVDNENFSDAWRKGYQEYRDFARQELQNGYERNPTISGLAEVGGALASPIKPFRAKDRVNMLGKVYHTTRDLSIAGPRTAIVNGIIGGIGFTDNNNPLDYAQNIAFNATGNFAGNKIQNKILGTNDMYKPARRIVEGLSNIGASATNDLINNRRQNDGDY